MGRPRTSSISRLSYCQYLLSSQINYTLTNCAEHMNSASHDALNRYLKNEKLTSRMVWEHVRDDIVESTSSYIVFDDTVLDKNHSRKIEAVRWQYSGNAHGIVRGIGMVNCIYVNPETMQFWVIDFRIFDPERDGKSKVDHVREMLDNVIKHKKIAFKTVLMDSWYASNKLMLYVSDMGKLFYCPIKRTRLARHFGTSDYYQRVELFEWNETELQQGKAIRLKGMPREFRMRMFRVPVSKNRTDYVATNDPSQQCVHDTQKVCAMRWCIEQFHRELKQLTGVEKCECRKQRIQRNHISCAVLVWVRLKQIAYQTGETVYQIKRNLLKNYLEQELRSPTVNMSFA